MSDDELLVRDRLLRLLHRPNGPLRQTAGMLPAGTVGSDRSAPGAGASSAADEPSATPSTDAEADSDRSDHRSLVAASFGGAGAFDPGRRGVKALAAVAAVVALGAAVWAWWARPHAEPVAVDRTHLTEPTAASPGPTDDPAYLVVAVTGRVRRPGLVRLPAGARVADAIEGAGGVLPGTDIALLNLARKVSDGELIVVGITPPPPAPGQPAGGGAPAGKVNLNTATQAQLETLPGVGPVLAQRILAHRQQHGRFRSVSELRQVSGIGDARYEQLKDLVTV